MKLNSELNVGDLVTRAGWDGCVVKVTEVSSNSLTVDYVGSVLRYRHSGGWELVEPAPTAEVKPKPAPKKRPKGAQEYKGNGKHYWQKVNGETKRLRVPGGWLYDTGTAAVFVPIPEVVGYAV